MNLGPRHLLRMARWAHKPPSEKRVKRVAVIILICLAIFGAEYFGLWPDALTAERAPRIKPKPIPN